MKQIKGIRGCNICPRAPAPKMTERALGGVEVGGGDRQEGRGSNQSEDYLLVKPEQPNDIKSV